MKKLAAWSGFVDDNELEPVVATEPTDYGWRGITADGQILEVHGTGIPEAITEFRNGEPIGRRAIQPGVVAITDYLDDFNRSAILHRDNQDLKALEAIERAITIVPTARARFNRSMILLALGRWREGFEQFERCEREPPFQRPNTKMAIAAGKTSWRGEPLEGKRLLLVHDHGFGDTIMMFRFVEMLRRRGAQIGRAHV